MQRKRRRCWPARRLNPAGNDRSAGPQSSKRADRYGDARFGSKAWQFVEWIRLPQPVSDNGKCPSQAISADLTGTSRIVGLVGEKGKLFDCTFAE